MLLGVNTLAGDVCTEQAQFLKFPSLLTGPEHLPEFVLLARTPAKGKQKIGVSQL